MRQRRMIGTAAAWLFTIPKSPSLPGFAQYRRSRPVAEVPVFAGAQAGNPGIPSTEARRARKAAGGSAADSSVGDSGRNTLARQGQYAQVSVDAKRSAVSSPWASDPSG